MTTETSRFWGMTWQIAVIIQANLVALAVAAQLSDFVLISPDSDNLPDSICTIESRSDTHLVEAIPCMIAITDDYEDADEIKYLGLGFLVPDSEPMVCQQTVALTLWSLNDTATNRDSLRILGNMEQNNHLQQPFLCMKNTADSDSSTCSTEGSYQLFSIRSQKFFLIRCDETYESSLDEDHAYNFSYTSNSPLLLPTHLDLTVVNSFEALNNSLLYPERFFGIENTLAEPYCDNLCPAGYAAQDSFRASFQNGTVRKEPCNRPNQAMVPFFNSTNHDYTFVCSPCTFNETHPMYRNAFLEPIADALGYQFKCDYPCRPLSECTLPFINAGFMDNSRYNRVCDCSGTDLRVVIQAPQVIEYNITAQANNTYEPELAESSGRYYDYEDEGVRKSYEFFCFARQQYCLGSSGRAFKIGLMYSFDNQSCYIPSTHDTYEKVFPNAVSFSLTGRPFDSSGTDKTTSATVSDSSTGINTTTILIIAGVAVAVVISVAAASLILYTAYKYRRHHRTGVGEHIYEIPGRAMESYQTTNPAYDVMKAAADQLGGGGDNIYSEVIDDPVRDVPGQGGNQEPDSASSASSDYIPMKSIAQ